MFLLLEITTYLGNRNPSKLVKTPHLLLFSLKGGPREPYPNKFFASDLKGIGGSWAKMRFLLILIASVPNIQALFTELKKVFPFSVFPFSWGFEIIPYFQPQISFWAPYLAKLLHLRSFPNVICEFLAHNFTHFLHLDGAKKVTSNLEVDPPRVLGEQKSIMTDFRSQSDLLNLLDLFHL